MNGHQTARDWLRERHQVITLLEPSPALFQGSNREQLAREAGRRIATARSKPARQAPRRLRRPPLTMLSLSAAEPGSSRPPWSIDPEITQTAIWLQRLPSAFEDLKIVHLTDIHHSLFTPLEEVERVVHLANR